MPRENVDVVENYLAQLHQGSDDQTLVQVGGDENDKLAQFATILAQLDQEDLAQITDILEDSNEELAEVDNEEQTLELAEIGSGNYDAAMFDEVAEFLAQSDESEIEQITSLFSQVLAG